MIYFVGVIGCLNIKDQLSSIKYSSGIISQLVVLVVVPVVLSVCLVSCLEIRGVLCFKTRGNRARASVEKTHAPMTHDVMHLLQCPKKDHPHIFKTKQKKHGWYHTVPRSIHTGCQSYH